VNIPRRPLNDGDLPEDILSAYDAADDAKPVPTGTYKAVAISGVYRQTATEKWYYRVTWEITEGAHTGRRVSRMYFLTKDAIEYTQKALKRLGLRKGTQLNDPFPAGRYLCEVEVTIRDFNGDAGNEVKSFTVTEEVKPQPDDFAPQATEGGPANG
jgi:hypothetical protein